MQLADMDDDDDDGGYKTADRAVYWTVLSYTHDLNIRLTLLIYQSGYHWWFLTNATIILALLYCSLYPRRNRAGSLNRKLLCSEPSLEPGNGLYRPSHLFYFLENDEGPSSIAPSHQTSLHWNHHSTHIRGIIWLQLCSTVIVGLCRTN